jgi:hypothetical protein
MPLPTQHKTNTGDEHLCPQRESNALSQQSSSRRRTDWTAQPPGSATMVLQHAAGWSATIVSSPAKLGPWYCSMLQGGRLKIITFTRRTVTGSLNQLNVSNGFRVFMSQIPFSIIYPSLLTSSRRFSNFRVTRPETVYFYLASTVLH